MGETVTTYGGSYTFKNGKKYQNYVNDKAGDSVFNEFKSDVKYILGIIFIIVVATGIVEILYQV